MNEALILELRNQERCGEMKAFLRVTSGVLSLPLFMAFWLADLVYVPAQKWEFLLIRSLMVPICLGINYLLRQYGTNLKRVQIIGTLLILASSANITSMIYLSEGIRSAYYAGLNLIAFGLFFVPWTTKFLTLNVLIIYGPYYLMTFQYLHDRASLERLYVNSFFIAGSVTIACVIRFFTENLRTREIRSRALLQQELSSREQTILDKTEEALRLTTLTKQFSPQVVHSIQSGHIDILSSAHRSQICTIFIDIVNSTEKVKGMDLDKTQKVLSMFMEDTMKVLLKYDITIDKFLGDGVLGFSNDPVKHSDFIERIVDASLEVRSRVDQHREEYVAQWGSPLRLRIGIAIGEANVGFYGSDEYFKSYTAIGKVVNLASRLCGAAEPDQILVAEDLISELPPSTYHYRPVGEKMLKGFMPESISTYEITGASHHRQNSEAIDVCPEGHGVLHIDTNAAGIFVFTCRSCGYVLAGSSIGQSYRKAS